ncbi:SapB [Campylobacter showae]|uniref:SapB n=1 Tax=Campylobacter showae CSUNSWCD TaxID=1244083 RepID=M5IQ08_9BACT|nr:SapB [Campylobacter showae]EKU10278.1 SapB [Campylobacter showae CSUNSWCD]
MAVTKAQVAQLYVALFNRAPEGAGLNAWVSAGVFRDQAQTADAMLQSPAIAAYFNGRIDSNLGYIENIYKNILGKDYSQDPDGINAWVRHLELGHSRGETLVTLFQVARSPEAIAADPTAAAVFANKTAIAAYMAEKITDIESDGSGNFNYAPFQDIIATTNSTNLEEQKAKIDQLAAEAAAGSKTFTTGLDNFLGTDGDDTFNGIYYAGGGAKTSTLSSLDTLDARGGKDTLNLTVLKNGADEVKMTDLDTAMNGISNIENLNIKSEVKFNPATVTINKGLDNLSVQTIDTITLTTDTKEVVAVNTTGVVTLTAAEATKEVVAKSSADSVTVNAAKLEGKVSIDAGAGANLTAAKAQEVVIKAKGNADITADKATKVNINLNDKANTLTITASHPLAEATDVTLSSLKLASATALAKATKISVTDVDFATFNISTDVENVDFSMNYKFKEGSTDAQLTAALAAANATNLTLHAKADRKAFFTYSGANDKLVKAVIDGDAKNLTADFSAQTKLANLDASAFTGNFANLKVGNVANSTVKLGSGNDAVELTATANKQTIDGGAGTDLVSVTSTIAAAGAGNEVTFTNFEGLQISNALADDVDMSKWGAFNNVTLVQGVSAGGKLQKLLNDSTITIDTVTLSADLVVGVKDAATGTADKVNFVLNPKATTGGLTGKFVVDDIENIDIASNLDNAKTAAAVNTIELKASAAAKDTLTNVVIKGDANSTILTLDATITKVKTVDASTLKGKFTFDASGHTYEKSVIKSGAGDDTITFGSKSGATVTGGAGKDTFVLGAVGDNAAFPASKTATITDFSKGDKLKIGANLTGTIDQNIARYDSTKSLDFANNLSRALDVATAASNKLAYFTYTDPDSNATDTYLVRSDTSAGLSANDYVVKLTGIVDLAGATLADAGTNLELTL